MKKMILLLLLLAAFAAKAQADSVNWTGMEGAGPFVSERGGVMNPRSMLGMGKIFGDICSLGNPFKTDIITNHGELVVWGATTNNYLDVSETTTIAIGVTGVAGVIQVPPPFSSYNPIAAGTNVQVANWGIVSVKSVPCAYTAGNFAGSSATAGQVSVTAVSGSEILVVLETKTTSTADPYIRARFIAGR